MYSTETLLRQAHQALNKKDLKKAAVLFEELTTQKDATVDIYYNLGVVQWLDKNPEKAIHWWKQALLYARIIGTL